MKKHIYKCNELVVGSNLAAVAYAYFNECVLVFKEQRAPFFYECFDKKIDLKKIFLETNNKLDIYNRFIYNLSLAGNIPFSDKIKAIRLEDNELRIVSNRTSKIKFNNLRIFEPESVDGLVEKERIKKKILVHDHLIARTKNHDIQIIHVGDEFVNKIYFEPSKSGSKKIVATSYLDKKDLISFDFSPLILKYKLKEVFLKNNIQKRSSDNHLVLEYLDRKLYNQDNIIYADIKDVIFDKRKEEEICQDILQNTDRKTLSTSLGVYHLRLNHLLLGSNGTIH